MKVEGHLRKAADVPQFPSQKTPPRPPPPNSASLSPGSASIFAGTAPSISENPPTSRVFCQGIDSRTDRHRVSLVGPRRESTKYGLPMSLTLAILFRRGGVLRSDHAPTHGKQRKIRNRHQKYKNPVFSSCACLLVFVDTASPKRRRRCDGPDGSGNVRSLVEIRGNDGQARRYYRAHRFVFCRW